MISIADTLRINLHSQNDYLIKQIFYFHAVLKKLYS